MGQVGGGPRGTMTVTAAHWRVCCPTGQQTWIEQQIPTPSQASPLLRAAPAARGPRAAPRPGTRRSSGRAARRWRRARRASPASWPAPGCARRAPRAAAAAAPGGPAAAAAQAALPQCPRHLPTPTRQRQGRSWTEPHTPAPARRQQGALWTGNPSTSSWAPTRAVSLRCRLHDRLAPVDLTFCFRSVSAPFEKRLSGREGRPRAAGARLRLQQLPALLRLQRERVRAAPAGPGPPPPGGHKLRHLLHRHHLPQPVRGHHLPPRARRCRSD